MKRFLKMLAFASFLTMVFLAPKLKAACTNLTDVAFLCTSMTANTANVCPGSSFPVSVTFCNTNPYSNQQLNMYIWLQEGSMNTGANITNALGTPGQWLLVGDPGALSAPVPAGSWGSSPLGGGNPFTFTGAWACTTKTFTVVMPSNLKYSTAYRLRVQYAENYAGQNAGSFYDYTFTSAGPNACGNAATLLKSVEGVAAASSIMIYKLDYNFFNSTSNQVQDVIPTLGGCVTIVQASPSPKNGAAAVISGNTVTWQVADASATSVSPYVQTGQVWVEVQLNSCACGQALANTGQFEWTGSGGWISSNTITQHTCDAATVTLNKSQLNMAGLPVVSVNNGDTVQYVLQYNLSGTVLKCFDSFAEMTNGATYSGASAPAGWTTDPSGTSGTADWQVLTDPVTGQQYLQYQDADQGTYKIMQYNTATCGATGANGFCGSGNMMQVDVRIDGNASTGDVGMAFRENGANPPNGYWVIMSIDPNPANLCLQVNTGTPAWPTACKYNAATGLGPVRGVWYTLKAMEQPIGTFYMKYWARGTPEPTGWLVSCTDNSFTCTGGTGITSSTIWSPGLAGQADYMSYQNFKLFTANSLSGATVTDGVPAGMDFQTATGTTSSKPSVGADTGNIVWDFAGSDNGAIGGTLYEGTGTFTWTGIANCLQALSVVNKAQIASTSPALSNSSNTVTLTINCGTPTFTVTPSCTFTNTATRTPTPTYSATPTQTDTASATPTLTDTPSPSDTPTVTATRTSTSTATPTSTITSYNTATDTSTITATPTFTSTSTMTVTRSDTPTATDTATITPSSTQTITYTSTDTITVTATSTSTQSPGPSATNTDTPTDTSTATPTRTVTPTSTQTITYTDTSTVTDTDTITVTYTDTPINSPTDTPTSTDTPTATPTYTDTATQTVTSTVTFTRTETATATDTPTATDTRTVTSTRTQTVTRTCTATITVSPTITLTPVPMPYTIVVSVYNSAGEVVRNLYSGTSQTMPTALNLQSLVLNGQQGYQMTLDGQLANGQDSLFWNEANDAGQQVDNGVYTFQVQVRDQYNHISTLVQQVAVASGQGTNTLEVFASNGEVVYQMALDRSNGDLVSFSLPNGPQFAVGLDASGSPLPKTGLLIALNNSKGADGTVLWSGLGLSGQLLQSGIYTVQLLQSGAGGSVILESRQVVLLRTGTPQGGNIRLVPNPAGTGAGGGTKVTLFYTPSVSGSALAEVYNIAGERVTMGIDSSNSGKISLDMTHAASGTYIVSLTIRDNGMVLYRKVAKLAVVH